MLRALDLAVLGLLLYKSKANKDNSMTSHATYLSLVDALENATSKKQRKAILARVRDLAKADAASYVK